MRNLKILVVGGGVIAAEKLEKLLDFTNEITVVASLTGAETDHLIKEHSLTLHRRAYRSGDIEGFDIVIVATDTIELHREIYEESRGSRVLVNSVDDTAYCDFIFPSYIKQGDLTVSFSTSGASPAFAKQIRRYFQSKIPDTVDEFLQKMRFLRTQMPKGKERMSKFDEMAREFVEKNFKS
jgi:precorrin-2 dehydrogenase/sirohydrochlorin ferrochelatase